MAGMTIQYSPLGRFDWGLLIGALVISRLLSLLFRLKTKTPRICIRGVFRATQQI